MRTPRVLYTYEVAHKQRPADKVTFTTLASVMEYTGLCAWSVYDNIRNGHRIGGWIITRTKMEKPKPVKKAADRNQGVVAYMSDGRTLTFDTQTKCAISLGISLSCLVKHLKDGTPDINGNYFDYPIAEKED